ncbi:hypothetical protein ACOAOT_23890 [Lacrimispora sp. AGF001]|uniref:hypothetical protein n=1 Tax=Lacrimispora sp. AGF001 TaxID=3401631 RepID=UPI003B42E7AF
MENNIRAVTPLFFQQALADEVKRLTDDMLFHTAKNGDNLVHLEVFLQSLPIPVFKNDDQLSTDFSSFEYENGQIDDQILKCPWCIVKIINGEIPGINEAQLLNVAICFGIFNDDVKNQGHREMLNLFQRVYSRFAVDPLLDKQYTCTGEFEWALQDEDTHPYFFGAISTKFKMAGYRRENKF